MIREEIRPDRSPPVPWFSFTTIKRCRKFPGLHFVQNGVKITLHSIYRNDGCHCSDQRIDQILRIDHKTCLIHRKTDPAKRLEPSQITSGLRIKAGYDRCDSEKDKYADQHEEYCHHATLSGIDLIRISKCRPNHQIGRTG